MQVHVAILFKAYLDKILSGEKTIEGRYSKVKCLPHGAVHVGDQIFLKERSGPIVAVATVAQVSSFSNVTPDQGRAIFDEYGRFLCLDEDFRSQLMNSKYITLLCLENVRTIEPIIFKKRNRQPWIILRGQRDFLGVDQWQQELYSVLADESLQESHS